MVAALGGRLGAYRDSRTDDVAFADALRRNLWRGEPVADAAVAFVVAEARAVAARLTATSLALLSAGTVATAASEARA
jgi:cytochrome b pre-mRNA-processing protein 3